MLTFIVIAVVVVIVAIAVVARRSARGPRPEAWEGHRTTEADQHWSGGGYGGGGGEAGPGGRAGP
jgi:hypothetical protein